MPARCNRWFFIAKLIVRSTCFGHHYAHHQELKIIIQVVAACGTWLFGLQVVGLVWRCGLCVRFTGCRSGVEMWVMCPVYRLSVWCGDVGYVSGLQDSAQFCNKESPVASS